MRLSARGLGEDCRRLGSTFHNIPGALTWRLYVEISSGFEARRSCPRTEPRLPCQRDGRLIVPMRIIPACQELGAS